MTFIKKKKLCILINSLGAGGAEKVVSILLPMLVAEYNVKLVLLENRIHFNIPSGVEVIFLNQNQNNSFNKVFGLVTNTVKYISITRRSKVDVSISFLSRPNLMNCFLKLFNNKIRVVISERCYPSIAYKSNKIRYIFYKVLIPALYNHADVLFSNSLAINANLRDQFKVKISTHVVYNPVINERGRFVGIGEEFYKRKPFEVVAVGTLYKQKNHQLIISALKYLNREHYSCTFFGQGPLRSQLEKYAKELGLDNITFKGAVQNVYEYLPYFHCFVLSSKTEGFPNALLEAMSVGVPVIATNCLSGPLEILNEGIEITLEKGSFYLAKYGILINLDDSKAMAKAIEFLANDYITWSTYSLLSKERSKRYDPEVIYNDFNQLLYESPI